MSTNENTLEPGGYRKIRPNFLKLDETMNWLVRLIREWLKRAALKRISRVAQIDPEHVTVDTVKMLFPWVPRWHARAILATGIRRGEFERNADGSYRFVAGAE